MKIRLSRHIFGCLFISLLGFLSINSSFSQNVLVSASAGTSNGSYATLKLCFDAINLGTHQGSLAITIVGNTTESNTAILNASGTGSCNYSSVNIVPSGNRTLSGNLNKYIIRLNGADNVTIDGLNDNVNSLTISNLNTGTSAGTVMFSNDACFNNLLNCNVFGSSTGASGVGIISFDYVTSTPLTGNDNNNISNCDIGPSGTNIPKIGINLSGNSTTSESAFTSGCVITNNNIHDIFYTAGGSSMILISSANMQHTISNNKFYQSALRTQNVWSQHYVINVISPNGKNFIISGNTIGYSNKNQTGTYSIGGLCMAYAIFAETGDVDTESLIHDNIITNISHAAAQNAALPNNAVFAGIYMRIGNFKCYGNTIGSQDVTNSITINQTGDVIPSDVVGIAYNGMSDPDIYYNNVGGISYITTTATTNHGGRLTGIWIRGTANSEILSWNCYGNVIGGNNPQSLIIENTNNNTTKSQVIGIDILGSTINLYDNTIRNLHSTVKNSSSTFEATVIGIKVRHIVSSAYGNHVILNNVIKNLVYMPDNIANQGVVLGIYHQSTSIVNSIESNKIYGISNNSSLSSQSASLPMSCGIHVNNMYINGTTTLTGSVKVINNQISIGQEISSAHGIALTTNNNTLQSGINGILDEGGTNNIWNNTVYIGGEASAGVGNSFAFNKVSTTLPCSIANNIFINSRSNSGTATGVNGLIKINGTAANVANLTLDRNIYYGTGTGYIFGYYNNGIRATFQNWKVATGKDVNSFDTNPYLTDPNSAYGPDMHININYNSVADQAGVDMGVLLDLDGQSRAALTPSDIGADAFELPAPAVTVSNQILFESICDGSSSTSSTSIEGTNLTQDITIGPMNGYTFSLTQNGTYSSTLTLSQTSGYVPSTIIWTKFSPTSVGDWSGSIPITGGGLTNSYITSSATAINNFSNPGISYDDLNGSYCVLQQAVNNVTYSNPLWNGILSFQISSGGLPYGFQLNATSGQITGQSNNAFLAQSFTVKIQNQCGFVNIPMTIAVNSAPSAGTISGTTAICANGSSTLTSSVSGGSWTSATPAVATIDATTGDVTGLTSGTSVMTYTITGTGGCSNVSTTATVTVTAVPTAGTISGTNAICANGSSTLTSSVTGGSWTSATPAVATIDASTGDVTGLTAGTSIMTYTVTGTGGCANVSTTATVTVTAVPNAGTISGTTAICANGSSPLTSSISGGSWSSATPAVAMIDATTGDVTGVSAGTSLMTYTVSGTGGCGDVSTTATVTVTEVPTAGTISGATAICANGSSTLTSSVSSGSWTSATPAVATINASTGAVAGVSAGTSVMTYTVAGTGGCANVSTTATVTVTAVPSAGTISGTTAICANGSTTLSSNGDAGAWSSSYPNVATINASTGAVTGVSAGTSEMTYTVTGTGGCANVSTTVTVNVTAVPNAGTISGITAICANGSSTLTSSVTGGTWSSGTPAVATINASTGAVTGVVAGSAIMTYTVTGTGGCANVSTIATVSVTAVPLTPIVTSNSSPVLCDGQEFIINSNSVSNQWFKDNVLIIGTTSNALVVTQSGSYYATSTNNGCSSLPSNLLNVQFHTPLNPINEIDGPSNVISGLTYQFNVVLNPNVTSYVWNLPAGLSIQSSLNNGSSIVINVANSFTGGIIKVKAVNNCGATPWQSKVVSPLVQTSMSITTTQVGAPVICGGVANVPFSATSLTGALYAWTLPAGLSFASGYDGDEQTIYVNFSTGFVGGVISCVRTTANATSTASYTVGGLATPGSILGPSVLCDLSSATYSISSVPNASSYQWQLPSGMTGTSTTTSITANLSGSVTGTVQVRALGACGSSAWRTLSVAPVAMPSSISGPTMICGAMSVTIIGDSLIQMPQTSFDYSVTNVSGMNYAWTVPTGMTITSGGTTNAIVVEVDPTTFTSGQVSVTATSQTSITCVSSARTLTVTKSVASITGPTAICGLSTATYSVPAGSGSNYTWTLPSWMTPATGYTLTSNPIQVDIAATGTSAQNISVEIETSCGDVTVSRSVGCGLYTQLSSASCGAAVSSLSAGISANNIVGAQGYKFQIAIPSQSATTYYYVESSDRWFALSEATSMPQLYGTTYSIKVSLDLGNSWGDYGAACTVTTPALPTTTLSNASCGASLSSISTGISSNNVQGATMYRFTITPNGSQTSYEVDSPDRWFALTEATGMPLLYGNTYSITVTLENGSGVWGTAGAACTVTTPTLPTTMLSQSSCGSTLTSLSAGISANNVQSAAMYRFTITPSGSQFSYEVNSPDRWIALTEATNMTLTYGATYSIVVAVQNGTGDWSNDGTACTVTTPTLPTTMLSQSSCGSTLTSLSSGISANNVPSAAQYRFTITPVIPNATSYEVNSPDRWITLAEATGMPLLYGTSYSIVVAVQNGSGAWGNPGNPCTVTTPSLPTTMLSANTSCGATLTSLSAGISANNVQGATMYEFHIIDGATLLEYTIQSPDRWIALSEGQSVGQTPQALVPTWDNVYTIKVKVQSGSAWSAYGTECFVNTAYQGLAQQDPQLHEAQTEGLGIEESSNVNDFEENQIHNTTWFATATSNPFAHSFQIKLNGAEGINSDASFTAQLTDMSGKVYSQATLSKEQLKAESFGEQLAPGMYLMTLRQGEELRAIRVVKR